MCQSSFSLLVVIAKIATCFPQHFSPHSFLLSKASVYLAEGSRWEGAFCIFECFQFSSPHLNWRVGTCSFTRARAFGDSCNAVSYRHQSVFQNTLQPPSSLRAPLKVVPDESHKAAHSAGGVSHLPSIIWVWRAECVPWGLLQVWEPQTSYCDGPADWWIGLYSAFTKIVSACVQQWWERYTTASVFPSALMPKQSVNRRNIINNKSSQSFIKEKMPNILDKSVRSIAIHLPPRNPTQSVLSCFIPRPHANKLLYVKKYKYHSVRLLLI